MKVFISHSSDDKWVARQISRLLEADGHETFLDEKDIKSGDSIDSAIQEHLKDSDHLLLLLSPSSISSHWVFIELGGAKALGKRVVPILLHVGANEVPAAISQLLAREINEFNNYLDEIRKKPAAGRGAKRTAPVARAKKVPRRIEEKRVESFAVGDRVRIVEVERLTESDKSEHPVWVEGMDKFSGAVTYIVDADEGDSNVQIAADGGEYFWAARWLSKVD